MPRGGGRPNVASAEVDDVVLEGVTVVTEVVIDFGGRVVKEVIELLLVDRSVEVRRVGAVVGIFWAFAIVLKAMTINKDDADSCHLLLHFKQNISDHLRCIFKAATTSQRSARHSPGRMPPDGESAGGVR